jgi:isoleucyl-tRNA synthetase
MFKPVPTRVDYVELEHEVQRLWDEHNTMHKYMQRNQHANKRWSFIDGPITANNPMGVHHAWGRSYKDLYNRFWTARGYKLRYQNGFDCQGLWIEVEVEKEMGFKSKRDIEKFGVAEFVEACKERVRRFADIMTHQSIRLGYWMDWDNSYYTNSDENNYAIWGFLKKCYDNGWIYKGKDTMPWCPRCGTGISQHEIVTEGYQDITHRSVYLKFPITGRIEDGHAGIRANGHEGESLLVWTTTPWTLAANVAAAVNPELVYVRVRQGDDVFYVSKGALATAVRGEHEVLGEMKGEELVGLTYRGPFDELPVQANVKHRVIRWDEVSDAEGTGIVHIAPGAGAEDFALSKEYGLDVIAPLDEDGTYLLNSGFGFLEGRFAGDVPQDVFDSLKEKALLYRVHDYTHRYPTCWRCGSELVFRLVDEWFISMDGPKGPAGSQDPLSASGEGAGGGVRPLREKIMTVTQTARWIPEFGLAREMDWLRNMHDWMISKKRYYGLALPIYECKACGKFEVIGSETQLKDRAVSGWLEFEGHSPHRPWVDAVKIACSDCGATVERIKDVGNPWLDAGIVPYSTLNYRHDREYWQQWFPADWVSESFPGQFRNWFYAMLAMSAAMEEETPFKTLFGYALLRDESGDEMHKSKGNAIWFDDAAERMGADIMRWMFLRSQPANNLNFGWNGADELKRGFLSTLWNTYSFFVTYANIDGWKPGNGQTGVRAKGQEVLNRLTLTELDRWALSELNQLVATVTERLENYDSMTAARQIEDFVESLSNWYVRRSRRRFWRTEDDSDKQAAYATLWTCLATVNRLMSVFVPFIAEDMYQNLVRAVLPDAPESIHLCDWPIADESLIDRDLSIAVRAVQRLTSLGRAARAKANIKVRQPLGAVHVKLPSANEATAVGPMADQITEELNVKALHVIEDESDFFEYQVLPNLPILGPKYGSEVGKVRAAISTADKAAIVRETSAGRPVTLAGFELQPDELLVSMTGRPGYAVAEEAGYAVAVTTEITPELADEGLARELVRRIQEMRKTAGFEIADRIRLHHEGNEDVARVMLSWSAYISQETLAQSIAIGDGAGHTEEHDIDGRKVKLTVEKV